MLRTTQTWKTPVVDDDPPDPWRLRAALAGDEESWAHIVDSFLPQVWRWARSCGLNRDDAEDVAQIIWYKLQDRGHTIRTPAGLPGWLMTTTRRTAIELRHRHDREIGIDIRDDGADEREDFFAAHVAKPDELAMIGDMRRRIATAYGELSRTCQELLAMSWSNEFTHQEIADALGRTIGYVGPTRQRCLETLRREAGIDG